MEVNETLEQVLRRQIETCRDAMDRAFMRWSSGSGNAEKAKKDMDTWEQRMFDAQFHLDKLDQK